MAELLDHRDLRPSLRARTDQVAAADPGPLHCVSAVSPAPRTTCYGPGERKVALLVSHHETHDRCQEWLHQSGLLVLTYPDPATALACVADDRPDLFVVDTERNDTDWMGFLHTIAERRLGPMVVLVEEGASPKRLADLEGAPRP
jgi:hypothetical protein